MTWQNLQWREIPLIFTNNSVGYGIMLGIMAMNKLGEVPAEMHYIIHVSCMVGINVASW